MAPDMHRSSAAPSRPWLLELQPRFLRLCYRRVVENNVLAMSAALSFRTIFAMVPVLIFAFLVLKSIGIVEDSRRSLREFLRVSGISQIMAAREDTTAGQTDVESRVLDGSQPPPTSQVYNVADEIERLLDSAESKLTFARIGPVGGILLIWSALALLSTMEASLNRIFGAPRSRGTFRMVALYWSVMTLGPVVLAVASYVGRRAIGALSSLAGVGWLLALVGWMGSVLMLILLLAAIYKLMPNTKVPYRSAIGGALLAVPVWMLARWAFSLYISNLVVKGNLYGVIGLLPLFLLWLNLSWSIFLFGAEVAFTATNLTRLEQAEAAATRSPGPSDVTAVALALARRFSAGSGPADINDLAADTHLAPVMVRRVLDGFERAGIAGLVGDEDEQRYTLVRPPERIAVSELLDLGDPRDAPANANGDVDRAITALRADMRRAFEGKSLAALMQSA